MKIPITNTCEVCDLKKLLTAKEHAVTNLSADKLKLQYDLDLTQEELNKVTDQKDTNSLIIQIAAFVGDFNCFVESHGHRMTYDYHNTKTIYLLHKGKGIPIDIGPCVDGGGRLSHLQLLTKVFSTMEAWGI